MIYRTLSLLVLVWQTIAVTVIERSLVLNSSNQYSNPEIIHDVSSADVNKYISITYEVTNRNPSSRIIYSGPVITFAEDPQTFTYLDSDRFLFGRDQFVNILKSSSILETMKISIPTINFNVQGSISYKITITESLQQKICHTCESGTINPSTCICEGCDFGFEGEDCSRQIHSLKADQDFPLQLKPQTITYIRASNPVKSFDLSMSFPAIQSLKFYIQNSITLAGEEYNKVPAPFNNRFNIEFDGLNPNNPFSKSFVANRTDAIAIINFSNDSTSISTIQLVTVEVIQQPIPVGVIVGIVVGLTLCLILMLIVGACYLWKKEKKRLSQQLDDQSLDKYFPQFIEKDWLIYMQEDEGKVRMSMSDNLSKLKPRECPICTQEIKPNDLKRITYCKHLFHSKCLIQWFHKKKELREVMTCPICRQEFTRTRTELLYSQLVNYIKAKNNVDLETQGSSVMVKAISEYEKPPEIKFQHVQPVKITTQGDYLNGTSKGSKSAQTSMTKIDK